MPHIGTMPCMAAARRDVPEPIKKKLRELAGEQCAICHRMLREADEDSGELKFISDIAHIYPYHDRGERGDLAKRPADVNDISNLIPLCPNCHRLIDWKGVGARLWPIDKLRKLKREHEAWIAFQRARPEPEFAAPEPGPCGLDLGANIDVDGHCYRLPWETRPGRVDGTFAEQWSPERDAVRSHSYAYAETGAARHVWLRRVAASDESPVGAKWRRELADEATLLSSVLPQLLGLPEVLAVDLTRTEVTLPELKVVTSLSSATCLQDVSARAQPPAEETVRAILAGLPSLCSALAALHDAGFAHGELEPAAILVGPRGNLVLRDLGRAAKTADVARPAKADDVMVLARIVYESVTGVAPLTGANGPAVPASVCNPAVPERAAAAISKALTGSIRDARSLARQLRATPLAGSRSRKQVKSALPRRQP
jgi:tRNA A-37 threonylcarbamoyl transferase component Bud32